MLLPVEMIEEILGYLDFHELLKFRLVSRWWKHSIECMCSRKYKSLALVQQGYLSSYKKREDLSNCLFGALKPEDDVQVLLVKIPTPMSSDFIHFVIRLFPNIEHFVFNVPLDSFENLIYLILFMTWWKNSIFALTLVVDIPNSYHQTVIAMAINRLTKLTFLNMRVQFDTSLLGPTLQRVHHLSLTFLPEPLQLHNLFSQIGSYCTRLWIEPTYCVTINEHVVSSWIDANRNLFKRLTHFGCSSEFQREALRLINEEFLSLKVWYIGEDFCGRFAQLGHVSRLNEVHVLRASSFWPLITLTHITRPMINVHTFEFCWSSHSKEVPSLAAAKILCGELAWLLPNVQYLHFSVQKQETADIFEKILRVFFKNLRGHSFEILEEHIYM